VLLVSFDCCFFLGISGFEIDGLLKLSQDDVFIWLDLILEWIWEGFDVGDDKVVCNGHDSDLV